MTLSKKHDLAREWRSLVRHVVFITQPLLIALSATLLWVILWTKDIRFSADNEAILSGAIIPVLGITFSILAAAILPMILEKYREVVKSVLRHDKETFLMYRDERLPIIIHLVLGSLAVSLIAMVMLINYHDIYCGTCSVFMVTFCISLYLIVAVELQDPVKSPWFAERIPKEWLTIDVDEYFKLPDSSVGK